MIIAGVLGPYVVSSALGTAAILGAGVTTFDETSMRVSVAPGGPADAAGVLEGDRILALDGQAVRTWKELKVAVAAHAHEAVTVEIERGGATRSIDVALPRSGTPRLMVAPLRSHHAAGLGEALAGGLALPSSAPPSIWN